MGFVSKIIYANKIIRLGRVTVDQESGAPSVSYTWYNMAQGASQENTWANLDELGSNPKTWAELV